MKLQPAGPFSDGRGRITVLDRAGLESRSFECHAAVKRKTGRLLPATQAR